MKDITQYLFENIKDLKGKKGIIVFDIDDTLIKVDSRKIAIWKKEPGKKKRRLSTEDFANDPDAADPRKIMWFDLSDFHNPKKVYQSICSGTPLIKNLRIMDSYINAGYDFCFLTARSCEEVVKQAIEDTILFRDKEGILCKLGSIYKKSLSHAVNDEYKNYPGETDCEKKANVLKKLCKQYDSVVFVDDDEKNIRAARNLKMKNLRVIKAWKH